MVSDDVLIAVTRIKVDAAVRVLTSQDATTYSHQLAQLFLTELWGLRKEGEDLPRVYTQPLRTE